MKWRQVLVPVGLLMIPALALGWLVLRAEDPPPPRKSAVEPTEVAAAQDGEGDDPSDDTPTSRRPPPRKARPSRAERDSATAPEEDEPLDGQGGDGEVLPEVGELYPHPAHDEAVSLLEEGDWAAALQKAEECLAEAPKHRGCYDDRLRAVLASGDMEAARDIVASCAEDRSNDPALCGSSSVLLALEEGDLAGAEELLATLEEQSPKSRFTMMARAQVFAEQGEDKMAKVNFSLACVQGHAVACKKAPGVKKAGGQ